MRTVVLVVDDEDFIRNLVEQILRRAGYEVLLAEDGPQALKIAAMQDGPIHVLLTDLRMPEMDGITLAKEMARVRPEIRVMLMSAYFSEALEVHEGCNFLRKPFTTGLLYQAVLATVDGPVVPLERLPEARGFLG